MATCSTKFLAILSVLHITAATLPHPLSDDFITLINSKQNAWKAGRNFPQETSHEYIQSLVGVLPDNDTLKLPVRKHHPDIIAALPDSFDPRDKWTNCPSLKEVRDQGGCGSCWAFGAVEAMTDRYCIFSKGGKHVHISAEDLLSCCHDCGRGCHGGSPRLAWKYWEKSGIVTGGNYNSKQGCRPYTIEECEHRVPGNRPPCKGDAPTPQCRQKCEVGYDVPYAQDKHYGKNIASVQGVDQIMAEMYLNGPIEAEFFVYEDFLSYKSGVYIHTEGDEIGGHAVKLMGWGKENGHKYWLLANSWNSDWGENGFFKILRGENHCNIENGITAGEPVL